ncbi:MAG: hypothetical protein OEW83_12540 [Acidimicrobiia bacterium]|nr:hypothetical protein [Acidimicrobiia bacterium]
MVDSDAPNTRDEWVVVVPPLPRRHADTLWDEWRTHAGVELQSDDIRVDLVRADGGDHRRYCVRGLMLVDTDQLVARLRQMGGEIGHIVEEHQADHGDILLHNLVADLRRFAERTFDGGPSELLDRLLRLLADAFDQADAVVANAIAVSFVEDSCLWKPEVSEFVAVWPSSLQREARRQLNAGS